MKYDVKNNSASLLSYITATASASSEAAVSSLLAIMNPTDDRAEMGEKYSKTIGYNPLTYFDEQYLIEKLKLITNEAPSDIVDRIRECDKDIIQTVMNHKESIDNDYLDMLMFETLDELVGWSPPRTAPFSKIVKAEIYDESFEIDEEEEIYDDDDTDDSILEGSDEDDFGNDID